MTFDEIVNDICEDLNLRSPSAETRIGRKVNRLYKRITSSIGVRTARPAIGISATCSLGIQTLTFEGIERIDRIIYDGDGSVTVLDPMTVAEIREVVPGSGLPSAYAIEWMGPGQVRVRLDTLPQDTYILKADGLETAEELSGDQEPQFSSDYHDILIDAVAADERRKDEKAVAEALDRQVTKRMSELRMFIAMGAVVRPQGTSPSSASGSTGGGGGSISGGTSYEQTGLVTFSRAPSYPFAVEDGSAMVDNLDAEMVGGHTYAQILTAAAAAVTTAGLSYISAAAGVITAAAVNLASHVTGRLPFANLTAATAASKLLGRRAGSAGDFEEITLGTGLSMTTNTLNAAVVAGSDTQVQFNDGGVLAGDAGLVYDKTNDILTLAAALKIGTNPASAGALRVANAAAVKARNAANSGDVGVWSVNSSNQLELADASTLVSLLGGQLKFPATANPSVDANTLDDYEEGTWTPSLGGNTTYTVAPNGRYTKIGRLVMVQGNFTVNAIGTGSTGTVSGLPFTPSFVFAGCVGYFDNAASSFAQVGCYASSGTTTVAITTVAAGGSTAMGNPGVFFANSTSIHFSLAYMI